MSWFSRFFPRRQRDCDLAEEIAQHLEEKTDALVAEGMGRDEARRAARLAFGNPALAAERGREVWQWTRLASLWADVRYALRRLRQAPLFSATAMLTLALGIGANTGVFTLMHALLLESLPIPDPGRLVRIALDVRSPLGAADDLPLNLSLLQSIQRHGHSLAGVFGWSAYDFVLTENTGLHVYGGAVVSGNTFQVLGIEPAAGRLLKPEDDRKGGGPDGWAAVVSHRFWREHYHSDPAAIGKRVTLSDHSVTIVGVAPQGFEGVVVAAHPDFYLPLEYEPVMRGAGSVLHLPGSVWLGTWARLKPGVSLKSASAEMHALYRPAVDETLPPAVRHAPVIERSTFTLRPGGRGWSALQAEYAKPLFLLQALVAVVLLVCCVNLAGLSLARAQTREHEFAIRGALGAPRSRLMRQPLLESLVLALAGGALAVGLAWAIDRYLLRFLADPHAAASLFVRPEAATLLATGGCAVLCALLFGTAPGWLAGRAALEPALRRKAGSPRAQKGSVFVPVQIALTLVLVVAATALGATVKNLRTTHLGFRTEGVYFVPADFERLPQKGADLVQLYRRMLARIGQLPGVASVSVGESTPLGGRYQTGIFANHALAPSEADNPRARYWVNDVGADYFKALGTQLIAGRTFAESDAGSCMLNRAAAASLFKGGLPLGQTVWQHIGSMNSGQMSNRECRIVGIVEDAKYDSLREAAPPTVYYPFGVNTDRLFSLNFVIQARRQADAQTAYLGPNGSGKSTTVKIITATGMEEEALLPGEIELLDGEIPPLTPPAAAAPGPPGEPFARAAMWPSAPAGLWPRVRRAARPGSGSLPGRDPEDEVRRGDPVQFALPAGPVPERHGVAVGAGVEVLDVPVRALDAHRRQRRQRGREHEPAAAPAEHGPALLAQVAVGRPAHGDRARTGDADLPARSLKGVRRFRILQPFQAAPILCIRIFEFHWNQIEVRAMPRSQNPAALQRLPPLLGLAARSLRAGRPAEAIAPLRAAARLDPSNALLQHDLGLACLEAGRLAEAAAALERAAALDPLYADAYFRLGIALETLGNTSGALAAYDRATRLLPSLTEAWFRAGALFYMLGGREQAIGCFRRAAETGGESSFGRLGRMRALLAEERYGEAEQAQRETLALDPGNAMAHDLLGHLLSEFGRFDEARQCFERAIALAPLLAGSYYELVRCRPVTRDDKLLGQMEAALATPGLEGSERLRVHLALGKAADDLGEYALAMEHLDAADAVRRGFLSFDAAAFAAEVDRIIARCTPEVMARAREAGSSDRTPILILGMPRSGTTLVEQIVSNHPDAAGAGELHFWNQRGSAWRGSGAAGIEAPYLSQAAGEYLGVLRAIAPTAARVTDKMPFNFLWAGLIHLALPHAAIIHCRRAPIDTALSIHQTHFHPSLAFPTGGTELVAYYRGYQRLMDHWRKVLPPERFIEVDYEQLTGAPEPVIRRILAACGLPWHEACLRPESNPRAVRTPSKWQARQPIYRNSVERWRRYEPWLGALSALVEDASEQKADPAHP